MNPTREQLAAERAHPNVEAFLRVVRGGETSQDDSAYRMLFGSELYTGSIDAHPRIAKMSPWGWTAPFGAYQIMAVVPGKVKTDTYDRLAKVLGPSMEPYEQDLKACLLLHWRGAMEDVRAGRLEQAIAKCGDEWASLPGSKYGQPTRTLEQARKTYLKYGGVLVGGAAQPAPVQPGEPATTPQGEFGNVPYTPAPDEDRAVPVPPINQSKEQSTMIPFAVLAQVLGPAISAMIPQVANLFNQSETAKRNTALAEVVVNTITKTAGTADAFEALEKMKNDPAVKQAVTEAVITHPDVMTVVEIGGGIVKAREAAFAMQTADKPFWYNPLFWITLMFLPAIYLFVFAATLNGAPVGDAKWWMPVQLDDATRNGLMNLLVGLIVGGVCGIWFGTTANNRKEERTVGARSTDVPPLR